MVQQKQRKIDNSWVFRAYRPVSDFLCRFLVNTSLTGDHISIFLMFFTPLGVYLLTTKNALAGLLILQLSLLLDCMDGALARMKGSKTPLNGYYYEAIWHEMEFPFFYLSLGIIAYRFFQNMAYLYLGIFVMASIFIINALLHRRVMVYSLKTYFSPELGYAPREKTWKTEFLRLLTCPSYVFTYAWVLYVFDFLPYMIIPYSGLYAIMLVYTFYHHVLAPRT